MLTCFLCGQAGCYLRRNGVILNQCDYNKEIARVTGFCVMAFRERKRRRRLAASFRASSLAVYRASSTLQTQRVVIARWKRRGALAVECWALARRKRVSCCGGEQRRHLLRRLRQGRRRQAATICWRAPAEARRVAESGDGGVEEAGGQIARRNPAGVDDGRSGSRCWPTGSRAGAAAYSADSLSSRHEPARKERRRGRLLAEILNDRANISRSPFGLRRRALMRLTSAFGRHRRARLNGVKETGWAGLRREI